eukprot:335235_1
MTTSESDDLPEMPTITHHKSLTDHKMEDCQPTEIQTSLSYQNGADKPHKQRNKKKKTMTSKKRKSEAAIYINTSKLFPANATNHIKSNGYKKSRHSTQLGYAHKNGHKLKTRSYNNDDYAPFDFSSYKQNKSPPTRRRACTTTHDSNNNNNNNNRG